MISISPPGNENETPSKGLIACPQGRKRLLMSPPHASPMKVRQSNIITVKLLFKVYHNIFEPIFKIARKTGVPFQKWS